MTAIKRQDVLAGRDLLPVFPQVIEAVLATLDDPDANMKLLVAHIGNDPVLAARIYAEANAAAHHTQQDASVHNLYAATALIGLARVRRIATMSILAGYIQSAQEPRLLGGFWEHCVATSVAAQHLAAQLHLPPDAAMIAGLLHDIGKLWLFRFKPEEFIAFCAQLQDKTPAEEEERQRFGVDHATIGGWLAESWSLPEPICAAISYHHAPDQGPSDKLVPVVHVAEVLSNALDLAPGHRARVAYLSTKSCDVLQLKWDENVESLFGRIEAASRYALNYFRR